MKVIIISFILLLTFVLNQDITRDKEVLVLTDANFNKAISDNKLILVEFYAPWCGHCKSLAPEYEKAAVILKEKNSEVLLAKIDATENKDMAEKFNIEGFPTLKFFDNGKDSDYNGGRTAEEIVSWLEKRLGPSYTVCSSKNELEEHKQANEVVVVFFGQEEGTEFSLFKETSQVYEGAPFLVVKDENMINENQVKQNSLVLFKNFDEGKNVLTDLTSLEQIYEFIETSAMKFVSNFDESTAEFIFGRSNSAVFLYWDEEKHESYKNVLDQVAPKFREKKVYFVTSGINDELEQKLAEYIGIKQEHLPVVKIHQVKNNDVLKYTLKNPITVDNLTQFVEDFLSGKLEPEYKSESIPETQDSSVYKIVGKSFNTIVNDPNKDVLVEFYAPWCGHCQALAPKYENLAEKLKEYKNLVIAKMDATENEVPGVDIEGYPTLKFYSHKNKEGVNVEGRSEYDLLDFLKSQELVTPIGNEIVFEKPTESNDNHSEDVIKNEKEDL